MSGATVDEQPAERPAERCLTVDGTEWIVRSGGTGAAGTGDRGLATIEAVHFYRPGEARPRLEALLARDRWLDLFEAELRVLLRSAVPLPPAG
jgi:hypothetical protein